MKDISVLLYIQNAKKNGKKLLAILLDPDKISLKKLPEVYKKLMKVKPI